MLREMSRLAATIVVCCGVADAKECGNSQVELYEPNWESLSRFKEVPDWFRDAKFGIYAHWGVFTVPEKFTEWYPRNMHIEGSDEYKYHRDTYGGASTFPYHNFVPMFKAEKFDAARWADAFKASGAKFAGPVAEHHDGFAMWDTRWSPWNSMDKGPKRDITGELCREIKKRGMKFITTFHHARHFQRNRKPDANYDYDSHYIYDPKFATSSADPELQMLYGVMDESKFNAMWLGKLTEVIDNYQPDLIYFDSWLNLIPEHLRQKFCAYYYNDAMNRGKAVASIYKQNDLPLEVGINDIEKGGHIEIFERPWMSDDTLLFQSWSYADGDKVKPASMVLHSLIDIVSKNGNLLLNISPRADGSIPADQFKVLTEMGQWLEVYGEAIFATRPWLVHGYGPTRPEPGRHGGMSTINYYSAQDFRYTQSKDGKAVYIIILGEPEAGTKLKLWSFAPHRFPTPTPVKKVIELSTGAETEFEVGDRMCYLTYPEIKYNKMANVFKLILE